MLKFSQGYILGFMSATMLTIAAYVGLKVLANREYSFNANDIEIIDYDIEWDNTELQVHLKNLSQFHMRRQVVLKITLDNTMLSGKYISNLIKNIPGTEDEKAVAAKKLLMKMEEDSKPIMPRLRAIMNFFINGMRPDEPEGMRVDLEPEEKPEFTFNVTIDVDLGIGAIESYKKTLSIPGSSQGYKYEVEILSVSEGVPPTIRQAFGELLN